MTNGENIGSFPVPFPWEEIDQKTLTLRILEQQWLLYWLRLDTFAEQVDADLIFRRAALESLFDQEAIADPARQTLIEQLYLVGAWYLGPRMRERIGFGLKTTRRQLRKVRGQAPGLADLLKNLDQLLPDAFRHLHSSASARLSSDRELDLDYLSRAMRDVGVMAGELLHVLAPKQSGGRPESYHRDIAVGLAMEAFELAGLGAPGVSRGSDSAGPARLTKPAGRLLQSYFQVIDRTVSESSLARSVLRERRRRALASKLNDPPAG